MPLQLVVVAEFCREAWVVLPRHLGPSIGAVVVSTGADMDEEAGVDDESVRLIETHEATPLPSLRSSDLSRKRFFTCQQRFV